jgi:Activator of Hsp90 ATPase homolog 1-like protein
LNSIRAVGGSYRIAMQPPHGDLFYLTGEFQEVDPPARLTYTLRWDPPDADDRQTVVTLSLADRSERSEVLLTQGEFTTEERLALHEEGWSDGFGRLQQVLSTYEVESAPLVAARRALTSLRASRHTSRPDLGGGADAARAASEEGLPDSTTTQEVSK